MNYLQNDTAICSLIVGYLNKLTVENEVTNKSKLHIDSYE